MSKAITTTWEWSPELELNCVLGACKNITNGFFQLHRFYPLPDNSAHHGGNTVSLPRELLLTHLPDFWDKVNLVDLTTIPYLVPKDLKKQLLPHFGALPMVDYSALKSLWTDHQAKILALASEQIGINLSEYTLKIYPVRSGTIGSFNLNTDQEISVFWRADQNLHTLVEIIISSVLRPQHDKLDLSWSESEAVIDHIMTVSPLARYLNQISREPYHGTLVPLKNQVSQIIVKESQEFLSLLGAPLISPKLTVANNVPLYNNLPLHGLTSRESKVLSKLIASAPHVVTYDELANLLFENDEDYSLAVLTKVIDRLRDKLEQNKLTRTILATERSQGYYLQI